MKSIRYLIFLLLISFILAACGKTELLPTPVATIPISNDAGETISYQINTAWVLLSGVDEHGLLAEPELTLQTTPAPEAPTAITLETGTPAKTLEIRHLGPQSLQRFYFVELTNGTTGWISDYYVVNTVYLFNINSTTVPVYSEPGGGTVKEIPNVSPAAILDPVSNTNWWLVKLPNQDEPVWVAQAMVKESPEEEFLIQHEDDGHDH